MNYIDRLASLSPHIMILTGFFHGVFRSAPGAGADVKTNVVRYLILKSLVSRGPHHPTEISAYLNIKKNTLSELIDRMTRDGLINRSFARDDRRKIILDLTPAGRAAVSVFEASLVEHIQRFLDRFDEDDRQELVGSLESLVRIIMKRNASAAGCCPFV